MKTKYFTLIIAFIIYGNVYSQNTISDLQDFIKKADMNYYIAKIQENVMDCYKAQCEFWKVPESTNPPKIDLLHKDKVVPMLTVQFVDMENFAFGKNIYNHITIDSTHVFTLACVDVQMNVLAFANYYDGTYAYIEVESERPEYQEKLRHVIKNINSHEPEAILFCHTLKNYQDLNSFMFIKEDKLYVYCVNKGDVIELNNYINQFFTEEKIRNLDNSFVPFVQQYYDKEKSSRRTRKVPAKYKIL